MRWLVLTVAVALGGCAGDFAGGLMTGALGSGAPSGSHVGGSLHQIRVPQQPGETIESVQNKALIEAARQAKLAGGTHFIVVRSSETTVAADSVGALSRQRPDYQIYIRIVTLPPDAQLPVGAVAVEEIEKFIAGEVAKPRG